MRRKKPPLYARWANPRGCVWKACAVYPGPWRRGRYVGGMGEATYMFVAHDAPAALMPGRTAVEEAA